MTRDELKRRFPNGSESFLRDNAEPVRAPQPQRAAGAPLVHPLPGETPGRIRFEVRFRVYSRQPLDWDNYYLKYPIDMLVAAGILPSDDWRTLEGRVSSHKVHSEAEERTEILITELGAQPEAAPQQ